MSKRQKVEEKQETIKIVWIFKDEKGTKVRRCKYTKQVGKLLVDFYKSSIFQKYMFNQHEVECLPASIKDGMSSLFLLATTMPGDYQNMVGRNVDDLLLPMDSIQVGILEVATIQDCCKAFKGYVINIDIDN